MQPTSISQAIGLAKQVETKLQAVRTTPYRPSFPKPPTIQPYQPPPRLLPTPNPRLTLPQPTPPKPPIPIRHLSPAEMDARRAKGLCFNCDERFHRAHKCKTRQFMLLLNDEPEADQFYDPATAIFYQMEQPNLPIPTSLLTNQTVPDLPIPEPTHPHHNPDNFHLSLHVLSG